MNIPEFLPVLSHGAHYSPEAGACVMEMVSFLAGEQFSDKPQCVNINIRVEAIQINDMVSDDNRNQIALLIPRFMNTSGLNENWEFTEELNKARKEFIAENNLHDYNNGVAYAIKQAFQTDEGDARRTNQEYDQIGIDWLSVVLDIADKHLGREEVIPYTQLIPEMMHHVSQKANA